MGESFSKNIKHIWPLFIIVILGFFLRFLFLGEVPVSMHRDEAYLGYNAYSILKTAKDVSGNLLPLHLESFFYSPAGYSYLSIPFVFLFGLSEFSVRFSSAMFGTLTIILVFLIGRELFKENKNRNLIALFSSLTISILPWHINLSRVGIENTVVVFFISLGVLLYLRYLQSKKNAFFIISLLSFGINFLIYQAPRAFLPIFIPMMAIIFIDIRTLIRNKFHIALFIAIIVLPVLYIILSPSLSWRIQTLSIFHHPETKLVIAEQIRNDGVMGIPPSLSRVFHNKVTGYSILFLENLSSHFSYGFLFSDWGFPDRFRIPNSGLLYIFQLPLIAISFIYLYFRGKKLFFFLFGWVALSFLGSSLTYDDIPNMQRTLIAVPAISIITGYGAYIVWDKIREKRTYVPLVILASGILFLSILYFLVQYFIQGRIYMTWNRQDGYKELVAKVEELMPDYKSAVITGRETGSTLLFLFYSDYDPENFQQYSKNVDMSRTDRISYKNFIFSDEECPLRIDPKTNKLTGEKGVLYINSGLCGKEIPGVRMLGIIKREKGLSEVFHILEVK